MNIEINVENIKKYLKVLYGTFTKSDTDAYRYLFFDINGDNMAVSAFNDYFAIKCSVPITNNGDNEKVCIEGKSFLELMRVSYGNVKMSYKSGKNVTIRLNNNSEYKLPTMFYQDFISMVPTYDIFYTPKEVPKMVSFDINSLQSKINSVAHCLSADDAYPPLEHIYVYSNYFLACNQGYGSLSKIDTDVLSGIMINKFAIYCINNMTDKKISIGQIDSIIYGTSDSIDFFCFTGMLDEYPIKEIEEIINGGNSNIYTTDITFASESVLDSLNRLGVVAEKDYNSVDFWFDKNGLHLSVTDGTRSGEEEIMVNGNYDEKTHVTFDGKMFGKMMKIYNSDVRWFSKGSDDIQYLSDGITLQFFKKQAE